MNFSSLRNSLIIGLMALMLIPSLSSCTSNRPHSAWMDVQHARELDHKKGNRSKHIQKHYAKAHHY